jgi:hypothetical protein
MHAQPSTADIDGMAFLDDGATAGAAFLLSGEAGEGTAERVDGWTVEIRAHSRIVLARGTGPDTYDQARDEALDAANKGLDLISERGSGDYWIRDAADAHIAWWREGSRSVVRVLSVPTFSVTVGTVTVTGGRPVVPPAPRWHESLRYLRLSQVTDDLFDAYRNLYLALESILNTVAPQQLRPSGSPAEREGDWFKRALGEAGKLVTLASFAPAGATDPVQALWDELYRDRRSALFHAKSSRVYLLPHSSAKRREVMESLRRITSLYLAVAEKVISIRRPGGGIFAGFWRMQTDSLVGRLEIVATDDAAPFSADDTQVNPSGGRIVALDTAAAPNFDRPFERFFLGQVDGERLKGLDRITRLCSVVDGRPHTAHIPDGVLRVPRVDRFEVLLALRAQNVRQPKRLYAS